MMILRAGIVLFAFSAGSANAAGLLDNYVFGYSKPIETKEASAVAYNWDTRTLMVTNDEEEADGSNIWGEYDLAGNKTADILLSGCLSLGVAQCDAEGLAYAGNGQFVVALERYQDIALLSEIGVNGSTRTYTAYPDAPTISIGPDAGNSGLEGIAFDRVSGNYYGVKERTPETIWQVAGANFLTETATITSPFDASTLPGLDRLSDIAVISNGLLAKSPFGDNLLILSGRSFTLLEVSKTGVVLSSYDLSSFQSLVDPAGEGGKFEGLTLDDRGNIYLVSDDGDGPNQSYLVKLTYTGAIPEPTSWAMMMAGFGLVGAAARRQRPARAWPSDPL